MESNIFTAHKILNSQKSSVSLIEPILADLKTIMHLRDEKFYNLMIAVTEAVNNAITHGNKLDAGKIVDFYVEGTSEYILVRVSDQGTGFNPEEIDDCLDPENLLKSSGRGVFIIRELMHETKITSNSGGTTVEMKYYHNR